MLIFDEVVTGFRFAYGGAQAYYGVTPDICTLGKAIGGGFPLAAIAGRADIMAHFDKGAVAEDDFMVQIGTLSRQSDRRGRRPQDAGDPEAPRRLRADLQDRPRPDGGLCRDPEAGPRQGARGRRCAHVRRRLHRPRGEGLPLRPGRRGHDEALQRSCCASAAS